MEWVEVRGSSVDVAVEGGLADLGLSSREDAVIEVIEEPAKGFLGVGSKDALVRVSRKPKEKRQRRRKRGGGGSGGQQRNDAKQGGKEQKSGSRTQQSGKSGRERTERKSSDSKADSSRGGSGGSRRNQSKQSQQTKERSMEESTPEVEIDAEGQAAVVAEFLNGLLDSFGLEGDVATSVEDDLILADVTGEQTEALIGPKGSIMQSVGELTRTVVQRKTHRRARLRLDVGGYQERRREALRIYTARLAEQVLDDGGELMLEAMNPADRKTVHDAVVDIEGVSSFSEGEEPNRSVVIALAPGVEPRSQSSDSSNEAGEAGEPEAPEDPVSDSVDSADDTGDGDDAKKAESADDTGDGDDDKTAESADETGGDDDAKTAESADETDDDDDKNDDNGDDAGNDTGNGDSDDD
jgi:spoIIIJ-associated protein